MARLYLLDHSLKSVGGHHFDYAFHVATAAERTGLQPVLGTHVRFRERGALPANWPVVAAFPRTTYSRHAIYSAGGGTGGKLGSIEKAPRSLGNPLQWIKKTYDRFDRARQLKQFANACRQVFAAHALSEGDQVFIPTLSEFDLQGLVEFLASEPATQLADWHLQFHFNVFDGREPQYDSQQERLRALRTTFRESLARVARHRLHFYNTSQPLTRQYDRLQVARFESLAYPINPAFFGDKPPRNREEPIRITCAGAIREEKGQRELAQIVARMWEGGFRSGRLQLVVQSNKSRFRLPLPGQPDAGVEPIVYTKHPLSVDEYVEFIRRADIGLLMYDSDRYYVRRAGVLGEMLAAGVPVIAPAGCWLSDQLAAANEMHREQLPHLMQVVGEFEEGQPIEPIADATNLLATFETPSACEGEFVRVTCRQKNGDSLSRIVRCSTTGERSTAVFPLIADPGSIQLSFANAYSNEPIEISAVKNQLLQSASGEPAPCGAVGLAFASRNEIPQLLSDMTDNLAHYQKAAAAEAAGWFARHDPAATIGQLLTNAARSEVKAA